MMRINFVPEILQSIILVLMKRSTICVGIDLSHSKIVWYN
jgi:hypothetical protein